MKKRMTHRRGITKPARSSDRVLEKLRAMILSMELAPGVVTTEESLCALLDCTRTPLREALLRLGDEHLVVAVPHRGVSVADLSILDFAEIIEAHESLERMVIRRAATRITDDQIRELERLIQESEEAEAQDHVERVVELDFETHAVFGEASGNRYLQECQEKLHRMLQRYIFLGFELAGTEGAIADHRRILDALRSRDPDRAEAVLSDHVHSGRDRMRSAL
jgi:DNA-binding GntR family transcriptional regulator